MDKIVYFDKYKKDAKAADTNAHFNHFVWPANF